MNGQVEKATTELVGVLEQLVALLGSLHESVREKLDAMRRADADQMAAASTREGELSGRVAKLYRHRHAIVSELCRLVDFPPVRNPSDITLRALSERLEPAVRQRLMKLAATLRDKMLAVAEANRVVEMVSRAMSDYFKELFSIIARDDESPATYSSCGRSGERGNVRVLDAMI